MHHDAARHEAPAARINIDSQGLKLYGSAVLKEKLQTFPELRS
jgi:hypothetical protein